MTTMAPTAAAAPAAVAPAVQDADELRRRELAEFLRSRRERIAPEQVGITYSGRRRTPGLRREEVAQLSGVGVTWYTWLEQGRDIRVSEQVLTAIARTLMLDRDERAHLFRLAGAGDQGPAGECNAVTPQQRAVVAKLDPYPACIVSGKYDVLAYNRAFNGLVTNFDELPVEDHNCLWLSFTDPEWKRVIVDWEASAARMVANLRVMMADHVGDSSWKSFVNRLCAASPEFADLWSRHEVRAIENKVKEYRHPKVGLLTFETSNTWLAPRAGRRLLTYVPVNAETERRLERLVGIDACN